MEVRLPSLDAKRAPGHRHSEAEEVAELMRRYIALKELRAPAGPTALARSRITPAILTVGIDTTNATTAPDAHRQGRRPSWATPTSSPNAASGSGRSRRTAVFKLYAPRDNLRSRRRSPQGASRLLAPSGFEGLPGGKRPRDHPLDA